MQSLFNKHKAYAQMEPQSRGVMVWLEHMHSKGRSVLASLRAQSFGDSCKYDDLKGLVDLTANNYSGWPQSKWYLDESSEKLMEVK